MEIWFKLNATIAIFAVAVLAFVLITGVNTHHWMTRLFKLLLGLFLSSTAAYIITWIWIH